MAPRNDDSAPAHEDDRDREGQEVREGADDAPPETADAAAAEADTVGADTTGADTAETDPAGGGSAGDERVVAVRRVAAAGRRWRAGQLATCALLLAVALTGGAVAVGAARDGAGAAAAAAPASSAVSPELLAGGSLDASIASLQAHLRAQPKDHDGWATLGLAYVEQARTKGDPSRYPQAEKALARSLRLAPGNDQALAGRAALAAARHDFADALTYADRALKQNPYSERALSSRIDALVELGRYDEASKAADTADARRPGVPVFTRYAYVRELRGDVTAAHRVLEQALSTATSRGDIAYVAAQLGQLSWNQGDYKAALRYYARALAADDSYLPALEGRARAQAASGDTAAAVKGMELVVSRYPLPAPLVELGELYEARGAAGDEARARDQYALVDAWIALARANGVNADLDTALAAAEHGNKASALHAARAEWARRHTVHTADALAWALHVNGRDKEALPYARQATATGYRNALFLYHRGMIERATGHTGDARTHLAAALKLNPGFSPLGARQARSALEALGAAK
ncbi:tetratricopeptide repeat protein [Streptomyces anandii]|uniref:tetratricopeptide repeat protein n=1 Tax=Streptomyces anandii TaxID=285454 RepID=UPI0036AD1E19